MISKVAINKNIDLKEYWYAKWLMHSSFTNGYRFTISYFNPAIVGVSDLASNIQMAVF